MRPALRCEIAAALVLVAGCATAPPLAPPSFQAAPAPEYDALFQRTNGWTGADGAYSVELSPERTLWLFSDTWVGDIRNGRHTNATLVHNSVALQHGKDPASARVEFFFGRRESGQPEAFIKPADGRGWFWLFDGVRTPQGLFLFLMQVEKADGPPAFGFKLVGSWLGRVTNPLEPPARWKIEQRKVPWARFSADGNRFFGSAVCRQRGDVYLYGVEEHAADGQRARSMILARVEVGRIADFEAWRFYSGDGWTTDWRKSRRLCSGLAAEYSVSWQPALRRYLAVYTESGMSPLIRARYAAEPTGPWSDAVTLFRCPEAAWHKSVFCYAAKGHAGLAAARDELLVTYVANSTDFWHAATDARLYWPRFLRVKFAD